MLTISTQPGPHGPPADRFGSVGHGPAVGGVNQLGQCGQHVGVTGQELPAAQAAGLDGDAQTHHRRHHHHRRPTP